MKLLLSYAALFLMTCMLPNFCEATQLDKRQREVRDAFDSALKAKTVSGKQFQLFHGWLTRNMGKEKWQQINWRNDLWEARKEAAKQGKPIFLWAMNGDPLGCT